MSIIGLRNDENFIATARPQSWRQTILRLYPNSAEAAKAPLTALTAMMKSESTDDPVYHWFQKTLDARRFKINADIAVPDAAITVDATYQTGSDPAVATKVKAGDVLWIEQTGEIVRVSADPSTATSIPVTRARAGTAATAMTIATSNPYMNVIGSAFEEGSTAPTSMSMDPVELSNYTQIFRSTLGITRTAQKTRLRTGDAVTEAKRECLEYFSIDMERAFWFNGDKALTTVNGQPARYTAGLIKTIKTLAPNNVINAPAGGLIDMNWLEVAMERTFRVGSGEKMMFSANIPLLAIQQAVRKNSAWVFDGTKKEYGMAVSRLTSPFGTLVMKVHPLFNQMVGGTTTSGAPFFSVANNTYTLDMANLRYRYIDDVKYEKDLTPIGLDGMKAGYLGECGLEIGGAETHFIWQNITGGTEDF